MTLASVVVTYHPKIEDLITNIEAFVKDTEMLMLWDNSERMVVELSSISTRFPQIIIHQDGRNNGLSSAYNWAIQQAMENGCTHLMTMDQDSTFEYFKEYRQLVESFNDSSVGIFTCPINHDIQESGYRDTTVCQSGSIYTMEMLHQVGGFREDLFIGMVDAEMSLRALEKGYKIYSVAKCNLIQQIGSGRKVKIFGHSVEVSDYGPLRHFYDSRNRILLWYEFPYDVTFKHKVHHLWSRTKLITKIALFEHNKVEKIKAILLGTWYGLRNQARTYPKLIIHQK